MDKIWAKFNFNRGRRMLDFYRHSLLNFVLLYFICCYIDCLGNEIFMSKIKAIMLLITIFLRNAGDIWGLRNPRWVEAESVHFWGGIWERKKGLRWAWWFSVIFGYSLAVIKAQLKTITEERKEKRNRSRRFWCKRRLWRILEK